LPQSIIDKYVVLMTILSKEPQTSNICSFTSL
jgi:hypothetical protein